MALVFNPLALCAPPAITRVCSRPGNRRSSARPCARDRRLRVRASAAPDQNSIKIHQQQSSPQQLQRTNGSSSPPQQQQQQQRPSMASRRQSSPLSPLDLWDPFMPASRSFGQMLDAMNQMLETGAMPTPAPSMLPTIQRRSSGRLPWDVMEDEEAFRMRVDMPGLARDEVKVSIVDDGFLLIKGETSKERKEGGDKWAARSVGSYESRVMIPDNVEVDKITAELKDGVLYVTVPKKKIEAKKPVEIQVS
ncbi:small heat shock protein, chloroplastic [Selaginella moellendorffii]|nr:small heat shock protein, chloroplastic [Selaginella moellendorffii]|eukprot:XP_002961924.2 small heat shock protein, chloroplastic [Selaginella moellendorffii]